MQKNKKKIVTLLTLSLIGSSITNVPHNINVNSALIQSQSSNAPIVATGALIPTANETRQQYEQRMKNQGYDVIDFNPQICTDHYNFGGLQMDKTQLENYITSHSKEVDKVDVNVVDSGHIFVRNQFSQMVPVSTLNLPTGQGHKLSDEIGHWMTQQGEMMQNVILQTSAGLGELPNPNLPSMIWDHNITQSDVDSFKNGLYINHVNGQPLTSYTVTQHAPLDQNVLQQLEQEYKEINALTGKQTTPPDNPGIFYRLDIGSTYYRTIAEVNAARDAYITNQAAHPNPNAGKVIYHIQQLLNYRIAKHNPPASFNSKQELLDWVHNNVPENERTNYNWGNQFTGNSEDAVKQWLSNFVHEVTGTGTQTVNGQITSNVNQHEFKIYDSNNSLSSVIKDPAVLNSLLQGKYPDEKTALDAILAANPIESKLIIDDTMFYIETVGNKPPKIVAGTGNQIIFFGHDVSKLQYPLIPINGHIVEPTSEQWEQYLSTHPSILNSGNHIQDKHKVFEVNGIQAQTLPELITKIEKLPGIMTQSCTIPNAKIQLHSKIPVVYVEQGTHTKVPSATNPTTTFDSNNKDPKLIIGNGIVPTNTDVPGATNWKVSGDPVYNPTLNRWEIPAKHQVPVPSGAKAPQPKAIPVVKIPVVYVEQGTYTKVPSATNPTTTFDPNNKDPKLIIGNGIVPTNTDVPGATNWKVSGDPVYNPTLNRWEIPANKQIPGPLGLKQNTEQNFAKETSSVRGKSQFSNHQIEFVLGGLILVSTLLVSNKKSKK